MILKNLVESIKQSYPNLPPFQIIKELDVAQKNFVRETRILETTVELTSITTVSSWVLPTDCISVKRIDLYNSDDNPLYLYDLDFAWETEDGNIYFINTLNQTTELPDSVSSVYLVYYSMPTALTADSSTISIPEDFYPALEAKAMEKFSAKIDKDFGAVKYWQAEYKEMVRQAKIKRNISENDSSYNVIAYDMASPVIKIKRANTTPTAI